MGQYFQMTAWLYDSIYGNPNGGGIFFPVLLVAVVIEVLLLPFRLLWTWVVR